MTPTELAKTLCRDLVRRVSAWNDREFIVTNFRYPDGDLVNLYVDLDRRTLHEPDTVYITDYGTTLFKCRENGVEVTKPREGIIRAICERYNVEFHDGIFWKRIDRREPGQDCLAFCEALTRISNLEYERAPRKSSQIPEEVEYLLEQRVLPYRSVKRHWTDPAIEGADAHLVDYRIGEFENARNIFHVTSEEKCTAVDAIAGFYRWHNLWVPTLSIIDPTAGISGVHLTRLRTASTKIEEGVIGNENNIVAFALGNGSNQGGRA